MVSYQVGIDLGTTYTAAAVHRANETSMFALGDHRAAVPSVVLLRADGTILTGEAAERRASSEPERVVREFKRRFGDTTPIIVGGSPYSAEALMSRLLRAVVAQIVDREGEPPTRLVLTHPANWGSYKRELLDQLVRLAGLDPGMVGFITEPEAAAMSYAAQERVEPGEVVAVYDLGGGTFDAAVLRRTTSGFVILGRPEGIERLGGVDFDAAVFAHVSAHLGDALVELDPADPTAVLAVARLRQDCVAAKEALSSDTDASIPVVLPTIQTEVRITRAEFESLIRPVLADSLESLRRVLHSASIGVDDVARVLLVGGSSRIPLVGQLVSSELNRPVAIDAHPKHAIALGAALAAGGVTALASTTITSDIVVPPAAVRSLIPTPAEVAAAAPQPRSPAIPDPPTTLPPLSVPVARPAPAPGPVPDRIDRPPVTPAPVPGFDPNATIVATGAPPVPARPAGPPKARPANVAGLAPPGSAAPRSPDGVGPPGLTNPPGAANPPGVAPRTPPPAPSLQDPSSQRTSVLPSTGDPSSQRTSVIGSGAAPFDPSHQRTSVLPPSGGEAPLARTAVYRPGMGPDGAHPGNPVGGAPLYAQPPSAGRPYPGPVRGGAPMGPVPVPAEGPGRAGRLLVVVGIAVVVALVIVGAVIGLQQLGG